MGMDAHVGELQMWYVLGVEPEKRHAFFVSPNMVLERKK